MAAAVQDAPFVPIYRADYVEQHSRPSVGFRLILAIPHLILVFFGGIVAFFVAVGGWFAALVLGRLPARIARFLARYLRYATRVNAYYWLITDRYPPFKLDEPDYPVDIEVAPGRLNRLAVLFRTFLALPAMLLSSLVSGGAGVAAFFIWLVVLITGRMPRALFEALVATLRYGMRAFAFGMMLTSAYPGGLFGDRSGTPVKPEPTAMPSRAEVWTPPETPPPPPIPATEVGAPVVTEMPSGTLVLSGGARKLLILFLILGALNWIGFGVRAATAKKALDSSQANAALGSAYTAFAARTTAFGSALQGCETAQDPLGCEQAAERELLEGLSAFDARLDDIDFPGEADREAADLTSASARLRSALNDLISAASDDEYLSRVGAFQTAAERFDAAVTALSRALLRVGRP